MSIKILLIEDRVKRQNNFLSSLNKNLNTYKNILNNFVEKDYEDFIHKFDSKYKKELTKYEFIFVHRSAFGEQNSYILENIREECSKSKKKLIFFSGGITTKFYSNEKHEFLCLNSKEFYSENFILFLEKILLNEKVELLELAYGNYWKANQCLKILEKMHNFLSINEELYLVKDFIIQTEIRTLNIFDEELGKMKNEEWIKRETLLEVYKLIHNKILKEVNDVL